MDPMDIANLLGNYITPVLVLAMWHQLTRKDNRICVRLARVEDKLGIKPPEKPEQDPLDEVITGALAIMAKKPGR